MSTDSVIKTLLVALEQTPDDLGMRLHIADLMLEMEDFYDRWSPADHVENNLAPSGVGV